MKNYKVWFLYGDDTKENEWHWIVVGAKDEHRAAIKAGQIIGSMVDAGFVIQKIEEVKNV